MPKQQNPDGVGTLWRHLNLVPSRAPPPLERLAKVCLQAEPEDSRLGDLSEQYVRTHEHARMCLGTAPWAMAASHLAADLRYLVATANVILFARAIDPGSRLAENGATALIALDLQERTMAMLRIAGRKLVLPALLLMGSALLINSAVDVWYTWRQTEALMVRLQREKAEAAAMQIEQFLVAVQSQVGWTTTERWATGPLEQRRFDYVRLLRQVPAITEITQLNGDGKELLRVSRLSMGVVDSAADFASDVRFTEALKHKRYFSPVYLRKQSEPYMSLALAPERKSAGVTLAEVNLNKLWDVIGTIKVGETGYAYVVDGKGRLIAHRDTSLVLRQPDLSALPQVAAAVAVPPLGEPGEGKTFDTSVSGGSVLSVHAAVPTLGWQVFVELPVAEAWAPLWAALIRGACMLGLGLVAALVASLIAARRVAPAQPART